MKKVLLTLSSMILLIGALLFLLYPKSKYKEAINYEVTEKIIEEIKEDKEDEILQKLMKLTITMLKMTFLAFITLIRMIWRAIMLVTLMS